MKNNTAKHSTDTTITTAEKYFGSIQSFPVTRQAKRYLACLGKAYDLREMFTRAIKADKILRPLIAARRSSTLSMS